MSKPSSPIIPGAFLFLSSVPLNTPCPPAMSVPIECLQGAIPDGGVLIALGNGATLGPGGSTPRPAASPAFNACQSIGGYSVAGGIHGVFVSACLRGPAAQLAFDAFYASLQWHG